MAGKVKKHEVALFLNVGSNSSKNYVRIAKSKELTIDFDPKTEDYDYIADVNPTTDLEAYAPKISGLPLTMYREEKDFQAVWDYAFNLKTGGEAVSDMILVYMFDENGKTSGKYKAWNADCTVVVKSINAVDGTIEFDLPFRGTVKVGKVSMASGNPTFELESR